VSNEEKDPSPLPLSSSGSSSGSPSRDALDSSSARKLTEAINGLRDELWRVREQQRALAAHSDDRTANSENAIRRNEAELSRLGARIEMIIKLVREVMASERSVTDGAVKKLEAAALQNEASARAIKESGAFPIYPPPKKEAEDEITAEHLKVRWSTLGGLLVKHGWIIARAFFVLAAFAAFVWSFFRQLVHRL
jgi:hypothetical protein